MNRLTPSDVKFASASVVDPAGKIFFYDGRVFRAIYTDKSASFCREVFGAPWIEDSFKAGLVATWISGDISLEGAKLVLEHQLIPFALHPAECTSYMHWLSAKAMIRLNKVLCRHGLILKDSHPWNIMFYHGHPLFVDFGSLQKSDQLWHGWLNEFRQYYAVPIWLASKGKKELSNEYRRQHLTGFGLKLFDSNLIQKTLFRSLMKLRKFSNRPIDFFKHIDEWLDRHPPVVAKQEDWASYQQSGNIIDPITPTSPKHKFIYEVLASERPKKVLDCAANKGLYSELAARIGASVIAFDYEEFCVNNCLKIAQTKQLDITPALMDFSHPTPASGLGLLVEGSYQRFKSDIVLALGLAHHLCITQGISVQIFCDICMNYASRGVIFEYVDPTDKHVVAWNRFAPSGYSLDSFTKFFSKKFPNYRYSQKLITDGINRTIAYFFK